MRVRLESFVLALLILPALACAPANAQTPIAEKVIAKAVGAVEKLKGACGTDLKTFCSQVTPGEGRLALCMMAHEDKVSDQCYGAIFDVADGVELAISNIWRAVDVCESDIDKVCGDVEPGGGRIAQCLVDKKSTLSSACRAEVAGFEARVSK